MPRRLSDRVGGACTNPNASAPKRARNFRHPLYGRCADPQTRAHREVRRRQVELDKEVVAEDRERLTVGDELRDVTPHHGKLRRRVARRPPGPAIAGQALLERQVHPLQFLAKPVGVAAHDEGQAPDIGRRRRQRFQALRKDRQRAVPVRVPGRSVRLFSKLGHAAFFHTSCVPFFDGRKGAVKPSSRLRETVDKWFRGLRDGP